MTVEAPQLVRCGECGSSFTLSPRNLRGWRQRGQAPVCVDCRRPPKPPDEAMRRRMIRWWLEESGLTRAEVGELARAVFG